MIPQVFLFFTKRITFAKSTIFYYHMNKVCEDEHHLKGAIVMKTKIWNVLEQPNAIIEAAQWIQKGRTIAFPTETVYGLGADATNKQAVNKIFEAKNRPQDNPLIIHVPTKDDLVTVVKEIPSYVEALMDRYTPGPLTFVLREMGVCA